MRNLFWRISLSNGSILIAIKRGLMLGIVIRLGHNSTVIAFLKFNNRTEIKGRRAA
jgi:hypothetical protein